MKLIPDQELISICIEIVSENLSLDDWRALESDDRFQTLSYVGGFDSTEDAFCFSKVSPNGNEFWFQLTMNQVRGIVDGTHNLIELRRAD